MGIVSFLFLSGRMVGAGAFFWKNKGFEQHARDIGLAEMPQVGVVPLKH